MTCRFVNTTQTLILIMAAILTALSHLATAAESTLPVLVSAKDIQAYSGDDLVFVDIRSQKEYQTSHIDQAVYIDVEQTFNRHGDPNRIAPLHQVQEFLSAAGIKNNEHIIIYDNGNLKNAAHLFWLLETYSHKKLSVLDGGYPEWVKQHGKFSTTPSKRPASRYLASISPDNYATKLTTRLAIDNLHAVIIDSRSANEFAGKQSKATRSGHIPNAISIPWSDNFVSTNAEGLVKDKTTLQQLYAGVERDKQVIAYCNRGKQSAVSYLIMRHLGFQVSIYDGGWLEWGNDSELPINTRVEDK